jgi:hypothetical protein
MSVDPSGLIEAVMSGLAQVPSAVIAAALIAGPTAIWLIVRFLNPPDVAKRDDGGLEELLWVCPACRSINEDRIPSCYRCHRLRAGDHGAHVAPVAEPEPAPAGPGVGIAVGPGLRVLEPGESWIEREVARASSEVDDDGVEPDDEAEEEVVAAEVAALAYEPVILEPRVTASGRPADSKPAATRARRKPPAAADAGAAKPKRARKTGSG